MRLRIWVWREKVGVQYSRKLYLMPRPDQADVVHRRCQVIQYSIPGILFIWAEHVEFYWVLYSREIFGVVSLWDIWEFKRVVADFCIYEIIKVPRRPSKRSSQCVAREDVILVLRALLNLRCCRVR